MKTITYVLHHHRDLIMVIVLLLVALYIAYIFGDGHFLSPALPAAPHP